MGTVSERDQDGQQQHSGGMCGQNKAQFVQFGPKCAKKISLSPPL